MTRPLPPTTQDYQELRDAINGVTSSAFHISDRIRTPYTKSAMEELAKTLDAARHLVESIRVLAQLEDLDDETGTCGDPDCPCGGDAA